MMVIWCSIFLIDEKNMGLGCFWLISDCFFHNTNVGLRMENHMKVGNCVNRSGAFRVHR